MPSGKPQPEPEEPHREYSDTEADAIFEDFEAKTNFVGLYDLLLKIDRRENPQLYA